MGFPARAEGARLGKSVPHSNRDTTNLQALRCPRRIPPEHGERTWRHNRWRLTCRLHMGRRRRNTSKRLPEKPMNLPPHPAAHQDLVRPSARSAHERFAWLGEARRACHASRAIETLSAYLPAISIGCPGPAAWDLPPRAPCTMRRPTGISLSNMLSRVRFNRPRRRTAPASSPAGCDPRSASTASAAP